MTSLNFYYLKAIAEPILDTEAAKQIAKGVKIIKKEIIDTSSTGRYINLHF